MNHSAKENPGRETFLVEKGLDLQMQSDLVRRAKEFGVKPEDWVGEYAEIYRKIITENPSLVESYRENKEEALELVERKLLENKN